MARMTPDKITEVAAFLRVSERAVRIAEEQAWEHGCSRFYIGLDEAGNVTWQPLQQDFPKPAAPAPETHRLQHKAQRTAQDERDRVLLAMYRDARMQQQQQALANLQAQMRARVDEAAALAKARRLHRLAQYREARNANRQRKLREAKLDLEPVRFPIDTRRRQLRDCQRWHDMVYHGRGYE